MLRVSVYLMCMQLHRLHKSPTYVYPVFTKTFEMRYPVLKEVCSLYVQLFPWQHTLYVSLYFIRTVCAFNCITCKKQFDSTVSACNVQNLENLGFFEILITQKLLICPKDPFVRSALIFII